MKLHDNGCYYTVTLSPDEVQDFADTWPCFGLVRGLSFEFDKRNGDLLGVEGDEGMDEGAVLAMSMDAQRYGESQLAMQAGDRCAAAAASLSPQPAGEERPAVTLYVVDGIGFLAAPASSSAFEKRSFEVGADVLSHGDLVQTQIPCAEGEAVEEVVGVVLWDHVNLVTGAVAGRLWVVGEEHPRPQIIGLGKAPHTRVLIPAGQPVQMSWVPEPDEDPSFAVLYEGYHSALEALSSIPEERDRLLASETWGSDAVGGQWCILPKGHARGR